MSTRRASQTSPLIFVVLLTKLSTVGSQLTKLSTVGSQPDSGTPCLLPSRFLPRACKGVAACALTGNSVTERLDEINLGTLLQSYQAFACSSRSFALQARERVRERGREREGEREGERERAREGERGRVRERGCEREGEREGEREKAREREGERERARERGREREGERERARERGR
ncbi:hypothetical protein T484DRAFT_2692398 [Baffinella frigidus]|nr:hypothetical protein T484DRAFT_2692398 [Cryptophyta sp. CCMP2293]